MLRCYVSTRSRPGGLNREMAKTTLFAAFEKLIEDRLTLTASEQRLAHQERRIIQKIGHVLRGFGYGLVPVDGRPSKREGARRQSPALPKTLKCPKCDRRFSRPMHVARHLSATHGSKTGVRRKTRTSKK